MNENKGREIHDCRKIQGDIPVVISRDTAVWALEAMHAHYTKERVERLFADDRSFLSAAFAELKAAKAVR
jgi:predicted ABC-class ATPase